MENNVLDIWDYNEDIIRSLTKQDILNAINTIETSKLTRVKYSNLLGNVTYIHQLGETFVANSLTLIGDAQRERTHCLRGICYRATF